jgi:hypothetical protein
MRWIGKQVKTEDIDNIEEELWELKSKLNSLCELLGVAFGGHGGSVAMKVEKKKDKK